MIAKLLLFFHLDTIRIIEDTLNRIQMVDLLVSIISSDLVKHLTLNLVIEWWLNVTYTLWTMTLNFALKVLV